MTCQCFELACTYVTCTDLQRLYWLKNDLPVSGIDQGRDESGGEDCFGWLISYVGNGFIGCTGAMGLKFNNEKS